MPEEPLQLLNQARNRAERLVGELQSQQAEMTAAPPALGNAIAAARRTLVAFDAALANANNSSEPSQP